MNLNFQIFLISFAGLVFHISTLNESTFVSSLNKYSCVKHELVIEYKLWQSLMDDSILILDTIYTCWPPSNNPNTPQIHQLLRRRSDHSSQMYDTTGDIYFPEGKKSNAEICWPHLLM